jgi:hypothetical protein
MLALYLWPQDLLHDSVVQRGEGSPSLLLWPQVMWFWYVLGTIKSNWITITTIIFQRTANLISLKSNIDYLV